MNARIIVQARELFEKAGYIARIQNQSDYEKALALMDELIGDRNPGHPQIYLYVTIVFFLK